MGCGCTKISNTCGEKLYAACVFYENDIPEYSSLTADGCYTLEEVVEDLYLNLSEVKEEIDLEELLTNGIAYELVDVKVVVKKALKKHAEMLITLNAQMAVLIEGEAIDISEWDLDFECIADSCDNPPTQLKDLIQLMITQICSNIT